MVRGLGMAAWIPSRPRCPWIAWEWIRAIRQDVLRSSARPSEAVSRNTVACHLGLEGRCIASMSGGDAEGQGPCMTVADEADSGAVGASEPVIVRFKARPDPRPRPIGNGCFQVPQHGADDPGSNRQGTAPPAHALEGAVERVPDHRPRPTHSEQPLTTHNNQDQPLVGQTPVRLSRSAQL